MPKTRQNAKRSCGGLAPNLPLATSSSGTDTVGHDAGLNAPQCRKRSAATQGSSQNTDQRPSQPVKRAKVTTAVQSVRGVEGNSVQASGKLRQDAGITGPRRVVEGIVGTLRERGVTVLFKVDTTRLGRCRALKGRTFDNIVWNFPHGESIERDSADLVAWRQRTLVARHAEELERIADDYISFASLSRRTMVKPTLAAVNGSAYRGGTKIVLNCDIVVASEEAIDVRTIACEIATMTQTGKQRLIRRIGNTFNPVSPISIEFAPLLGEFVRRWKIHYHVPDRLQAGFLPPGLQRVLPWQWLRSRLLAMVTVFACSFIKSRSCALWYPLGSHGTILTRDEIIFRSWKARLSSVERDYNGTWARFGKYNEYGGVSTTRTVPVEPATQSGCPIVSPSDPQNTNAGTGNSDDEVPGLSVAEDTIMPSTSPNKPTPSVLNEANSKKKQSESGVTVAKDDDEEKNTELSASSEKTTSTPGLPALSSTHRSQTLATTVADPDTVAASSCEVVRAEDRPWFTDELVERLNKISTFTEIDTNTYYVTNMPSDITWGTSRTAYNSNTHILCRDNKPLTIWVHGELAAIAFRDEDGLLVSKPAIALAPFRDTDLAALKHITTTWSTTKSGQQEDDGRVWLGKWARKGQNNTSLPFAHLYDASGGPPVQALHDLVRPRRPQQMRREKAKFKTKWDKFDVRFGLEAIYRLREVTTSERKTLEEPDRVVTF
ncbi:hypothetical protein BXZ70DRAFT_908215 [Cristinia sonorae]|uniref:25S rRNA (uridine-N(3))-methyltransferase BMT5-like domain-containing protein n=1 Tax=Cristinia sonorae TaxID=1940300 RepID=A0A8K0ULG4_9AGAR|nr:hypothetical protein BXZ70DRAFT_908215 [Cristinia sonorae]